MEIEREYIVTKERVMYLVIAGKPNGDVTYFGPFQTSKRALEYLNSMPEEYRSHIVELVVPNCIGVTFTTKY
jgi:hypothetical protein